MNILHVMYCLQVLWRRKNANAMFRRALLLFTIFNGRSHQYGVFVILWCYLFSPWYSFTVSKYVNWVLYVYSICIRNVRDSPFFLLSFNVFLNYCDLVNVARKCLSIVYTVLPIGLEILILRSHGVYLYFLNYLSFFNELVL